mmetsp:Transcript_15909/g.33171  ORF Transcript_15909/g.33171 Transcript_15909/m.33171 type:complete len:612 (+) Transcript_15909:45-1880(+)
MNSGTDGGDTSQTQRRNSMTLEQEKERRASIQAIMRDPNLTPQERRKSIQYLMNGRRRSSTAGPDPNRRGSSMATAAMNPMAAAAAAAAAEFEDSSDEEENDEAPSAVDQDLIPQSSDRRFPNLFRRSSASNLGNNGIRRASLRNSFTLGFSKMGVKSIVAEEEPMLTPASDTDPNAFNRKLEKSRPPCNHYQRNCSIVSPCCGMIFGCRICHDDSDVLPPPFLLNGGHPSPAQLAATGIAGGSHTMEEVPLTESKPASASLSNGTHRSASLPPNFEDDETHHNIDRFAIKEVICRECYTRQSSKTNHCINCGIQFGGYHCSICNLWMPASEDPYHCEKCGFCRVGGRENFAHCDDCGMCIDALLFDDHNCKSGKYMSNCPVCQEDLFSSRMASHEMPCGHAIHWHCFRELTSFDTRCPVCKKTAETHDQMEQTWSAMAMGIALQPVPTELTRVVDIICNDCEEKSENLRWHFLGVQCEKCTSFNTTVERTVLVGQEAANFLGPPPDIASQAWASNVGDHSVLAALLGGGGAAGAAMAAGLQGDESMDTEALNQSVTAEVMGLVNQSLANSFGTTSEEVVRPYRSSRSNRNGSDEMVDDESSDEDDEPMQS